MNTERSGLFQREVVRKKPIGVLQMNTERSGLFQREVVRKKPIGVLQMSSILNNKIKRIFILLFAILLISSAFALGVTPGRTTIDFSPNLKQTVSFEVINSEGKDMRLTGMVVNGELDKYGFERNYELKNMNDLNAYNFIQKFQIAYDAYNAGV
jgi:hypothetical protein